ncbi:hypothetical protein [Sinorhizobium meliloti]|uniref:hypothetical protein n=1 Tax=Rhizobium meliloti TaxID=382 RepID=UPI000FD6C492|nr:hypothetical protein [Sinorhizobium meliloti]RVQ21813.1 hypothetical protein CN067_11825 [Sinorhizobium meliloti]RVQ55737.1 hypothetical protein CN060_21035 [Sinorhizobium meliloti]
MALEGSAAYIVVAYDSGPLGFPGMQALINEKAAEGYSLHQVIERSTYQWVLIFKCLSAE